MTGAMNVTTTAPPRIPAKLQLGIYRDGDNNLDSIQSAVLDQATALSGRDPSIAFDVEDFTKRADFASDGGRRTERYAIRDGAIEGDVVEGRPANPSSRATLAAFVAHTLDEAERNGASRTWLELVDHGGADAGGLENRTGKLMRSDDIAGAIADGIAMHAAEHPEDAGRRIDGVVANQCLMATLGFTDALSHAGVKYLAASPETMIAPGVPTGVAEALAHDDDPATLARDVVRTTMRTSYEIFGDRFHPAAAFDVLDCDPAKVGAMERAVRALDGALAGAASDPATAAAIRDDVAGVDGMTRSEHAVMPYRADRPAIALYDAFANDGRLGGDVRAAALGARDAVGALVLAHAESDGYAPFGGASYRDASGPTVHVAARAAERDPWAPQISETDTAFYRRVGAERLDRALGTA